MSPEQRKNTRVSFHTTVDLTFPDQRYSGCATDDLSLNGVSVQGVSGRKIGEKCGVSLALAGSSSHLHLTMKGEVVRLLDHGVALHFLEISTDSLFHLKNIITYNSGDPDAVEQETFDRRPAGK